MAFYDRNRTSGRLGAGAVQAAQDATSDASGGATPGDSANAGLDAIGAPTSHVGGGRATAGTQRVGIGLGRRAMNASRNFYSTDPRYTQNTGWDAAPEQQKVYSNDGGVSGGTVRDLGQVQAEEQAARPAPAMPAPAPQQTIAAPASPPAPAPAIAQPASVAPAPAAAPAPAPSTAMGTSTASTPADAQPSYSYVGSSGYSTIPGTNVDQFVAPGTTQSTSAVPGSQFVAPGATQSIGGTATRISSPTSPDISGFLNQRRTGLLR